MKKIIFILLVIVLTACSAGPVSDLERNRQTWQDAKITHYSFDLFVGCFCVFRNKMPLTVEVQNGEVVSMTYPDGTLVPADDPSMETFAKYATIERLFSQLEADEAEETTVNYDETRGFPSEIRFDFIKDAMDDEISILIEGFEEVK